MEWISEYHYELIWLGAFLMLLLFYLRQKKRIRKFCLGAVTGLLTLILLHNFGSAIGFAPALCLTNLLISIFLGIPGVGLIYLGGLL